MRARFGHSRATLGVVGVLMCVVGLPGAVLTSGASSPSASCPVTQDTPTPVFPVSAATSLPGALTPEVAQPTGYDRLKADLLAQLSCDYTSLRVDEAAQSVTITLRNGANSQAARQLAASDGINSVTIESSAFSRSEAEAARDRVVAKLGRRPFEVWIDSQGTIQAQVFDVAATDSTALASSVAEPEVNLQISSGPSPFQFTDLQYAYPPDRAGQFRYTNMGGGAYIICTAGPELGNAVYGDFGTFDGHCGPNGYGVFGNNVFGGQGVYINAVAADWCFNGCNQNADVATYAISAGNVTASIIIPGDSTNTVYHVQSVGGQAGPPIGTQVCESGYSSHFVCGSVASDDVTIQGINHFNNAQITIHHSIKVSGHPSLDGDSGGPGYHLTGVNNNTVLYGTVEGSDSSNFYLNNIYYVSTLTSSSVFVCGC